MKKFIPNYISKDKIFEVMIDISLLENSRSMKALIMNISTIKKLLKIKLQYIILKLSE